MSEEDLEVKRFVAWWYRVRVKHPADTVAQIATEAGCSEANIRDGIAEAERLLDGVQPALDAGLIEFDHRHGGLRVTKKGKRR